MVKDSASSTSADPQFAMQAWDAVETGDADTIARQVIAVQHLIQENQKLRESLGKLEQRLRALGQ